MKIGICIVLYSKSPEYINTYSNISDFIVAVDNGHNKVSEDIHYISMNGNKGIAAALNRGLNYLYSIGCDLAITMDDDSSIPDISFLNIIEKNIENYGLIGLNFNEFPIHKKDTIIDVPYWLTSGNFVNLQAWKEINGYREELFIDYVDFDFCNRLRKAGYKVGYLKDYSIMHTIGNPIKFKILGKTFHAMNHPAIRDYYRFRNASFLAHEDFKCFGKAYLREIFWELPKMLVFEDHKAEKLSMVKRGMKDAREGKLGKYEEKVN